MARMGLDQRMVQLVVLDLLWSRRMEEKLIAWGYRAPEKEIASNRQSPSCYAASALLDSSPDAPCFALLGMPVLVSSMELAELRTASVATLSTLGTVCSATWYLVGTSATISAVQTVPSVVETVTEGVEVRTGDAAHRQQQPVEHAVAEAGLLGVLDQKQLGR